MDDTIKLGILHFGDNFENAQEIVDYAASIENLGFEEFWLGEHYTFKNFWVNPEPILPLLLAYTDTIRIGSAGILIKYHSPYRVANYYQTLSSIFPDRLTIGYAAGEIGEQHIELLLEVPKGSFVEKIKQTNYFFKSPYLFEKKIPVVPWKGSLPEQWILTNNYVNSDLIIDASLNVCRSLIHGASMDTMLPELLSLKNAFLTKNHTEMKISIAIAIVCHRSLQTALELYKNSSYSKNSFIHPTVIGICLPPFLNQWS